MKANEFKMPLIVVSYSSEVLAAGPVAARAFWMSQGAVVLARINEAQAASLLEQQRSGACVLSESAIEHLQTSAAPEAAIFLAETCQDLSEEERCALAFHEEGHFINHHLEGGKLGWFAGLKAELEADRHAVANTSASALVRAVVKISNTNAKTCLGVSAGASKVIGTICRALSPTWLIRRTALAFMK